MRSGPSIKTIKRFPFIFLGLILIYCCMWIAMTLSSIGEFKVLNVSVDNLKVKTYKNVDLGENNFTTGSDGRLHWKVKNVKEAFLIAVADRDAVLQVTDLLYFLVITVFLFLFVYGINEDNLFSKFSSMLRVLSLLIVLYPGLLLLGYRLSGNCLNDLTNGQFNSQYRNLSILKYVIISFALNILAPFIAKGKSLQQEQDLPV